jgi:hypothetical protein
VATIAAELDSPDSAEADGRGCEPTTTALRIIAVAFALQLLVPTLVLCGVLALGWERPMRAGWQMYSSAGEERRITVELTGGGTRERGAIDYLLNRREMKVDSDLLTRLCAAEPDAIALSGPDGTREVCR